MTYSAPSTAGKRLAYAERVSSFGTTNTVAANAAGEITGLTLTVVGQGKYVDIEFFAPTVYHSVANTQVGVAIAVNGNGAGAQSQLGGAVSPSTTTGPFLYVKRSILLTAGQTYTFKAYAWGAAAGTATFTAAGFAAITLTATNAPLS